jgi:molybdopterin-guanine dinucleotide biosynthesis protein A
MPRPIEILILAGGRSSRMGQAKDELRLENGRTFLEHIIKVLTPLELPITLSVGEQATRAQIDLGLDIVRDTSPFRGPLSAIARAWQLRGQVDLIVVCCDQILLTADIPRQLIAAAEGRESPTFTVSGRGQFLNPFPGYFPALSRESIEGSLATGNRSPKRWADTQAVLTIGITPSESHQVLSFNSFEDLVVRDIKLHPSCISRRFQCEPN